MACVREKELVRANVFKSGEKEGKKTCYRERLSVRLSSRRCVLPGDSWNSYRPIRSAH